MFKYFINYFLTFSRLNYIRCVDLVIFNPNPNLTNTFKRIRIKNNEKNEN